MNCKDVRNQLEAWLDGELDETAGQRLQAHLEQCAGCAARVEQQRALSTLLRRAPDQPAPPRFRSRLLTRILQQEREQHHLYFLSGLRLGSVADVDPVALLQADSSRPVLTYREYAGTPVSATPAREDIRYVPIHLSN